MKTIKKIFNYAGFKLLRKEQVVPDLYERLQNIKHIGFEAKTIFDCGAFVGNWTLRVSKIFQNATFILIEPNKEVINRTRSNIKKVSSKCILMNVALGLKPGSGYLNVWENTNHKDKDAALEASSLLSHVQGQPTTKIPVEIQTLDNICAEHKVVPELVKLDLQGAELSALNGATSLFGKTELFIIEFGCLDAYINRTTLRDLIDIMYDNGYCLYDIVGLGYRPYDKALSGGDLFFIHRNSKLKEHKNFF